MKLVDGALDIAGPQGRSDKARLLGGNVDGEHSFGVARKQVRDARVRIEGPAQVLVPAVRAMAAADEDALSYDARLVGCEVDDEHPGRVVGKPDDLAPRGVEEAAVEFPAALAEVVANEGRRRGGDLEHPRRVVRDAVNSAVGGGERPVPLLRERG